MLGFIGEHFDEMKVLELTPFSSDILQSTEKIVTTSGWCFAVSREALCTDAQAAVLVSLWDRLPPGETARCHIPGFAIQLSHQGRVVFTAALCWKCNNISIAGDLASENWRAFNAESVEAIELLRLCETAVECANKSRDK
jgi:hypothetical protein